MGATVGLPNRARHTAGQASSGTHAALPAIAGRAPFAHGPRLLAYAAVLLACVSLVGPLRGADAPNHPLSIEMPNGLAGGPEKWTSPEGLSATIQVMLLLTVLSIAPAILLMTTCFVRMVVVLSLLRQAVGTQTLPPNQVITALALFMTLAVMTPVWKQVYDDAILPYTQRQLTLGEAWTLGAAPVRRFMREQIERTGNRDDVWLFLRHSANQPTPASYDDVPTQVLLPAFMLSELKTAFSIGFRIYLPFLILDLVVASVMVSMGMMMLPPVLISLPFKILLFVLVDGWHLVVGMLMDSFQPFT
ncbi:MAG: flagellar type III secretion system pore protein FliP [Thermoguttaceae bacterium]|jgi:flagellar biosynthetic protein FliP